MDTEPDKDELLLRRAFLFRLMAEQEQRTQLEVQKTVMQLRARPADALPPDQAEAHQAALRAAAEQSLSPARPGKHRLNLPARVSGALRPLAARQKGLARQG